MKIYGLLVRFGLLLKGKAKGGLVASFKMKGSRACMPLEHVPDQTKVPKELLH